VGCMLVAPPEIDVGARTYVMAANMHW